MTTPTTIAQPVLSYATPDQIALTRQTVLLVRMFGVLHELVGFGAIAAAIAMIFDNAFDALIAIAPMMIAGAVHLVIGVLLFRDRESSWRKLRLLLAILLFPALGFIIFATALFLIGHEGKGWDGLVAVAGVIIGAIASAPYWLNLITMWYLMRPHPRALFSVSVTDSFIGRKIFMRTMAALWALCVVVCLIAWIVP